MHMFSNLKRLARWTKHAAHPGRLGRSLLYQCNYLRAAGRTSPGLHIGSGGLRIPEFINIDADAAIDCDLIGGSEKLKFADASIGAIYASHLFEHIPRARTDTVLCEWHRVLKPGGSIYLCVPDLEALAERYLTAVREYSEGAGTAALDLVTRVLYGGQSDGFDFHYNGYSMPTLQALLESVGFTDVRRFDRATLAFAPFTDCGSAMIEDRLVSLNVTATKGRAS
jgi:predicted SAM-dependent methyltransferase